MSAAEQERAKASAHDNYSAAKSDASKAAREAEEAAKQKAKQAEESAKRAGREAKEKAVEVKNDVLQRLREDGVVNPNGFATLAFGPLFLAAIPAVTFVAQPGGLLQKAVNGVVSGAAYFATAGNSSAIAQTAKISALSFIYLTATYAFGSALSATAIDIGTENGRSNEAPRKQVPSLVGLPDRLFASTQHTLEHFGGFALVAGLAQAIAPADQSIINLLGLHVITKLAVFGPAYTFNAGPLRTVSHVIATGSILAVAVKLIKAPLL